MSIEHVKRYIRKQKDGAHWASESIGLFASVRNNKIELSTTKGGYRHTLTTDKEIEIIAREWIANGQILIDLLAK